MTAISETTFLRGQLRLAPSDQLILVENARGAWSAIRVSLTSDMMHNLEGRLMALQHERRIVSYFITAARSYNFAELLHWLREIGAEPQQGELINIETNTLFSGGGE